MAVKVLTLRNATDTFVREAKPSATNQGNKYLYVRAASAADSKFGYVYFPISLPDKAVVTKATLTLTLDNPASGSRTFTVSRVTEKWVAANTKWSNRPDATSGVALTKGGGTSPQDWSFNVTAHVQAFVADTKNFGWRVTSNEAVDRKFFSAQAGAVGRRPELVIEYNLPPNKPTNLTPSGGLAVSKPKPVLSFTFTDPNGNTSQKALEVQVASNPSMTGAATYSATTNASALDLASTAYPGLAQGSLAYWRVRAQDQSNLWSDWSPVTSFTYQPKPAVAVSSPSGTEFYESTPTVTWTMSAGTQTKYQVLVYDSTNVLLYNSGEVQSALREHRIPVGVIRKDDESYRFLVTAWDDVARAEASGDPSGITAEKTATFQYTGAVAPVTDFDAMALSPKPGVRLSWTRTGTVDEFEIRRDGEVIAAEEAGEFLVSGTSFEFYDYEAPTYKPTTYQVVAKVLGAGSADNPTDSVTSGPVGIWLIDKGTGTEVHLLGDDNGTWNMGEVSAVYAPVSRGGDFVAPTIVTQALRGYEGNLSGTLTENTMSTKTLDEMVSDVWKLKRQTGKTYTLIVSDMVMKVVIANVNIVPNPNRDLYKTVSFDFWQVDNPRQFMEG